jgi:hypothetical protein
MDTVVVPNGEFVFRTIGDETILVPVKAGVGELDSLFTFNEVGTVIWKGVETRSSVREIVSVVQTEFEIDPESAQSDVLEFLESLIDRGLIQPVGG